jgi:mannose-1-phosphate guanylyltransferase
VLAGGDGQRMEAFIRRWLGHPRPKQYCAFSGRRTMLEHTLDRATDVVDASRVVTVVNADHRRYMREPRPLVIPGRIVEQPRRCDTGPGVFLPLTAVMSADPEALVAIMPSDHFIHPRAKFSELLDGAYALADYLPGQVVLLSARPDAPEADYGWIAPGMALTGRNATLVGKFQEKPKAAQAAAYYRQGGLWNTMIMVGRVSAFWEIARSLQPSMIARFDALRPAMGLRDEAEAVARAYQDMESVNFSRDIVQAASDRMVAMPMDGVHWSDWGRPQRIAETLAKIGKAQSFPAHFIEEPRAEAFLARPVGAAA